MTFQGGEWALLIIGLAVLVAGIVAIRFGKKKKAKEVLMCGGLILCLIGLGLATASFSSGVGRSNQLQAVVDLRTQGFTVLNIPTGGKTAVVLGPANCLVRLPLHHRITGYDLEISNRVVTPKTIVCKYITIPQHR